MSAFSASTTADEVISALDVNLEGKNIFVTGSSSGIGAEAARVFACAGAHVWMAGRDVPKTQAVADSIAASLGSSERLHVIACDLSSLRSVKACAAEFNAQNVPLHVLLNNAGCMAIEERTLSEDGVEMQFATNHLGHFLLTQLLLPSIRLAGQGARIVNVSSMAHRRSPVLFDNIDFSVPGSYEGWKSYGQSKTANILHATELNARYGPEGIVCVSLHPGVIETELWRHAGVIMQMNKTIPQGAATSVFCCVAPEVQGGRFYNDCNVAEPAAYSTDATSAARLWSVSEQLTASFV